MKLHIIAVGKLKKPWIQAGIQELLKRIPEVTLLEVKDSTPEKEALEIINRYKAVVPHRSRLIALSEEGELMTSVEFADLVQAQGSDPLVFAIGGPNGIAPSLKQIAFKILSLSPMTFPHELARLLLVEQLYRAKTILNNGSYHRADYFP